jgi:polyisoprenyl-phosphate glycosyltransferase
VELIRSENEQLTRRLVSVCAPAYNEELNLEDFCREVSKAIPVEKYDFEIVICENGSDDHSLEILRKLHAQDNRVRYVSLSRNFGAQGGLLAAISGSRGDAVITMDADLQHPPSVIPQMLQAWENGFKIVMSKKETAQKGLLRYAMDSIFYYLMDRMANLKLGHADFRLLDRRVVNELLSMPESEKFLRGLISWMGFSQTCINYTVAERNKGESKFRRRDLFDLAFQGITSFSIEPLRLLMKAGIILFVPSALFMMYNLYEGVSYRLGIDSASPPPGWATLSVTITLFGSIQLLGMSILGEYIGRIFIESKKRPSFIIQETSEEDNNDA